MSDLDKALRAIDGDKLIEAAHGYADKALGIPEDEAQDEDQRNEADYPGLAFFVDRADVVVELTEISPYLTAHEVKLLEMGVNLAVGAIIEYAKSEDMPSLDGDTEAD